MINKLFIKIFT